MTQERGQIVASDLPYRPCVGVVLVNGDGLVWAGRRSDSETPAWQFPQGGIDAGEDPRQAALRELHEETGIPPDCVEVSGETRDWLAYDLPAHLVGKALRGKYRGQTQKWFLLRFLGTDDMIDIVSGHPEFSAWRWMPAAEALDRIVAFKRDTYESVLREFSLL